MKSSATHTCKGKGGSYQVVGQATGAGTSRFQPPLIIYMDMVSGRLFYRTPEDFYDRMERIARPAITAALVMDLRERTDAPISECKLALERTNGDIAEADTLLRTHRRLT